jgi:hypothetical protein
VKPKEKGKVIKIMLNRQEDRLGPLNRREVEKREADWEQYMVVLPTPKKSCKINEKRKRPEEVDQDWQ